MIATDKLTLKEKVFAAIDAARDELFDYAKSVAKEPEFGFREFKTAKKVEAQFDKLGIPYRSHLAITGVKGLLKGGKPGPTIAILGELDAISSPDHPLADPDTGAAHACGHHMQQSAMLAAAYGLARTHALDELCGNVVFFAVPAKNMSSLLIGRNCAGKVGSTIFMARDSSSTKVNLMISIWPCRCIPARKRRNRRLQWVRAATDLLVRPSNM